LLIANSQSRYIFITAAEETTCREHGIIKLADDLVLDTSIVGKLSLT